MTSTALSILRRGLLAGAACIAALPAAPGIGLADDGRAAEAAPVEPGISTLEPLTVTARRRPETIQDAPVAVTVIGADRLGEAAIRDLDDAAKLVPNTSFSLQGGPLTIRGIGSLGMDGGVDRQPGVGLFVDDVYIARPNGYPTAFQDLDRVEVVRGAQSTVYGKNTIGGAVNLVSPVPGTDPGMSATAGLGSDRRLDLRATLDTPLTEDAAGDLAVRATVSLTRDDGFIRDDASGTRPGRTDRQAARVALGGMLGDATDFVIRADVTRDRDDGGLAYAPLPLAFDHRATHDTDGRRSLDSAGVSATLTHDAGGVVLRSITAIRGHDMDHVLDGDFTGLPYYVQAQTEEQRQISQELRLSSPEDGRRLGWTAGLFYMREDFNGAQFYDLTTVPRADWSRSAFDQTTDTASGFGEARLRVLPSVDVTAGLRYTREWKRTSSRITSPSGNWMMGGPLDVSGKADFDDISPETTIRWRPGPQGITTFARVARGFKSGGISPYPELDGGVNRYDPETVLTWELGARTLWLGDRLAVDVTLFRNDWKDQQVVIYTSPLTRVLRNAARSTSQGAEVEARAQLTDAVQLRLAYGYLDAQFDDFVDTVQGTDYSGNDLPYAPEHTLALGADLRQPAGNGVDLIAGIDYAWRSSMSFTPSGSYRQGDTHLVDGRIGFDTGPWAAALWARNLLDEEYLTYYYQMGGTDIGVAGRGRSLGLQLTARW
ncbi:TonB-dependent receptor [Tistrella sp. BH-R2-4]|uniref:TonB-dependent receptor n=1 Tax=Tistrella arctica TaxID=3133430 RepID=A0ABU9YPI7_9PROT